MHRTPFPRARWVLLAVAHALIACGSPASEPTPSASVTAPTSADPASPTTSAAPIPSIAEPAVPIEAVAVAPSPSVEPPVAPVATPETGLPPVSAGPTIRLESTLPVTTREVNGRRIASVTLASPTAQASLDAWFERHAWCRGRVQLAIDGLVSYVCSYDEPAAGGSARAAMNVRITESGEVETLAAADFFVPGTDVNAMARVWADDPSAPLGEMSFGPAGAAIVPADEGDDVFHVSWRTIAPYVRADGPLGAALAARGLTLAPPGTSAPPTPLVTTALVFGDAGSAMEAAAQLAPAVRASTRLRVGSDESVLLLPPGTDRSTIEMPDVRSERRYLYGAVAELVPVRVEGPVEIHESAGPRTPVIGALPAGAAAVAARGPIGARVSELGTGWVLIASTAGAGGYAQGRDVAADDGCGAPAGSRGAIGGYAELALDARFAWTVAPSDDRTRTYVTLFPVGSDCAIGVQSRRASVEGTVTDLRLVRATADGPEWLLVVVVATDLAVPARTVAVFGPQGDAPPVYSTLVDAPVIRLAERRGPDRAPGYFPVTIATRDARTWLSWNGETIDALAP